MLSLNEKLSAVQLLRLHCLYFICEQKFYARSHVKITRHWKSTLSVDEVLALMYNLNTAKSTILFLHIIVVD